MFFSLLYYSPSAYEKKLSDEDWKLNGETSIPVKNYHFRDFALMHNHHQIWCFLFTSAEKWIFHAFLYVFAEKRSGMDLAILSFGRDDMCSTLHHHITSCECSIHVNIFNIAHCTLYTEKRRALNWIFSVLWKCFDDFHMVSGLALVENAFSMFISQPTTAKACAHFNESRGKKEIKIPSRQSLKILSRLPRYQVRDYTFFLLIPQVGENSTPPHDDADDNNMKKTWKHSIDIFNSRAAIVKGNERKRIEKTRNQSNLIH